MEQFIAISTINDFLYCPKSLYMHMAAGDITPASYHEAPQKKGKEMHETIDTGRYSSKKDILKGTTIFSEEYGIQGKLDTFDISSGELVERKAKLKNIYEGHLMQLYSEYYCLIEMGYSPKKIAFYSMEDNKKYPIDLPGEKESGRLKDILEEMRTYTPEKLLKHRCPHCENNIYAPLNW